MITIRIVCQTYYFSNQLANMVQLTFWVGGRFMCDDFSKISKHKVIDLKSFDMRLKEFCIKFESNKLKPIKLTCSPVKVKKTIHRNKKKAMNMFAVEKHEFEQNEELSPEKIGFSSEENNNEEEYEMSGWYLGEFHNDEFDEYEENKITIGKGDR